MAKVVGIKFKDAGKLYYFSPGEFHVGIGDNVIVETARGLEFGKVTMGETEVSDKELVAPLKNIIRIATEKDKKKHKENIAKKEEALRICQEKVNAHKLDMKLIDVEYTFDNSKVIFYFTADGRVDFRELVKDLAGVFKTRIELRQIGVRDETKIVGGIGICGRPLCCHSYLADFVPVSIKMAKEQNLSLNPTEISGVCGRLMCCLKNEEETYEELNRKLPGIGDYVTTEDGLKGEVQSVNVLRQLVKVVVEEGDEKEIKEYPVEQLQFRRRHGKKDKVDLSKEEMQELEKLEEEELQETTEAAEQPEAGQRQNNRNRGRQGGEQRPNRQNNERRYENGDGNAQGNRQEGEQRRENRNRQNGEQRRDNRNRQNGEQRQNRQNNERRYENGDSSAQGNRPNRQNNEGRYENGDGNAQGNRQEGEQRRENRNRQNYHRNRHNRQRPGNQEGQARHNDNQSEG